MSGALDRRWVHRHGIQTRFFVVLAVLVVASLALLGASLYLNQRNIMLVRFEKDASDFMQTLTDKGNAYSTFIARIAPQGILSYDYLLLEGYVEELAADPDVVYAVILNRAHEPLTNFSRIIPSALQHSGKSVGPRRSVSAHESVHLDPSLLIVQRPIQYNNSNLGMVEVALSKTKIDGKLEELKSNLDTELRRTTVLTAAGIIVSLILLIVLVDWAFNRMVARPIQLLGAQMSRAQRGDFRARAIERDDEIGWLAKVFNKMSADLQDHVRRLETQRTSIKETRDYLANILDNSADMIITTALDGTIVEFNPATERILGYTRAEIVGTPWESFIRDSDERKHLAVLVTLDQPVQHVETSLVRRDGKPVDVELTLSPLRNNAGHTIGTVYIGRDVTHAKALRRELMQSERMASVGQVASWIAHQIRNALARILMTASGLKSVDAAVPKVHETHQHLTRAIEEMDELVTDLLDYSKTLNLHLAPTKLNACLDGLLAVFSTEDKDGKWQIERDFAPVLPAVPVDVFKIEQAFGNVIKNAWEAMPDGGTLRVTTRYEAQRGSVCVTFQDSGPGIPPEDLAHVCRPFYTTKATGTGLGLAIASRITQAHGGSCEARNGPHGGACFIFRLPCTHQPK